MLKASFITQRKIKQKRKMDLCKKKLNKYCENKCLIKKGNDRKKI